MKSTEETLPWVCPDHPSAQIRHSWDQSHYIMNGYPAGLGIKSNDKYECAVCGRELAPPDSPNNQKCTTPVQPSPQNQLTD